MTKSQKKPANDAGNEAAAEWAPLESLKGWPKNPRKNAKTIKKVAKLIQRLGWGRPLGARRQNGEIIWGHSAAGAAWLLIKTWADLTNDQRARWHPDARRTATERVVPVRFREDLSEDDAHDLALADNRSQEFSEWDDDLVAEHLGNRSLSDAALLGWDSEDLADLLDDDDDTDSDDDGGTSLGEALTYSVVIECRDETHQGELLERLEGDGLVCRPLVS